MNEPTTQKSIALDPVADHLRRKAAFFENEALILADQVRELIATMQPQQPLPAQE